IIGLCENITSGTYIFNGIHTESLNEQEMTNIRKNNIGFLFPAFYLVDNLNMYENILIPTLTNPKTKSNSKEIVNKLILSYDLKKIINKYPEELSNCEKQISCIVRSIVNNPKVIIADDPTINLNEYEEKVVLDELLKLSQKGMCVIIASNKESIKKYANHLIVLSEGKVE
ncbi:MAG: ATP-binding cassette domain-containing protein, partial [Bacilli bacterium]|nr:ATP-binding cassette domain-containing protein [Bacilli bacterium]